MTTDTERMVRKTIYSYKHLIVDSVFAGVAELQGKREEPIQFIATTYF